jgi:methionine-rich copper-binding protein CopC
MRVTALALLLPILALEAPAALAHAFLDHATPGVGSVLPRAPAVVSLWFTQELEPAFSTAEVVDRAGGRVDSGPAEVDRKDATLLRVPLKPLSPGTYKVIWRVVSIDSHTTDGSFTFRIGSE